MMDINAKKIIITLIPHTVFFYFAGKTSQAFRLAAGADMSAKVINIQKGFAVAFENPLPSLHPHDLIAGLVCAVLIALMLQMKKENAKKIRKGVEHGSARWGTANDIKPFIDPVFENNIILTKTERLTMDSRPKNPAHARNKNVICIGGSGSGKTRFYVKPNIMQCISQRYPVSFCVTDPKGTILLEVGQLLQRCGYEIRILNTINFKKSMKYNPLQYLRSEKDILKLVTTLITNTKGEGEKATEDFWVKAEKLYYTALIGYIFYEGQEDEKNFNTMLEMINASDTREDDEDYKNPVDIMFDRLAEKNPDHFAVQQYLKYKMAAGVVSCKRLINQVC